MTGYQPVELPSLDTIASHNPEAGFARSILAWIAIYLSELADAQKLGIRIDVITVTYLGSYPALGVVYLTEEREDMEAWVIEEGEKMLAGFSLARFSEFVREHRSTYVAKLDETIF